MSNVKDCSTCWHRDELASFPFPFYATCKHRNSSDKHYPADFEFIRSCHGTRWESKYADERRAAWEAAKGESA